MKTNIFLSIAVFFTIALTSCEDYLDKLPEGDMTLEEAFSNYKYAERFLANVYMHLPAEINYMADLGDTWARNPFTAGCDEMEIAYGGSASHLINAGAWNASNVQTVTPIWSECYMGIRKANLFLENIDNVPLVLAGGQSLANLFDEKRRNQWKGEAYFLRAFAYFQLVRTYGPVPITEGSLGTNVEVSEIKRKPLSECIQYILDDCETAAGLLPIRHDPTIASQSPDLGRPTRGAALALKSRMLLYAASPIYNGHRYYTDFKDHDGVNLFPTSPDESLWTKAATAAKECINELEAAGHKLYKGKSNVIDNYRYIFLDRFNEEWIFWRNLDRYDHFDNCSNMLSLRGYSILNPTQEMVDAFQMADGSTPITGYREDGTPIINPASGYQETGYTETAGPEGAWPAGVRNMFVNREPRFYACVQYPGSIWQGTTCDFWFEGKDGRRGAGSDYCKTGYLLAKIVNPNVNVANNTGREQRCWVYFRLAEIYLNYAEALNESQGPVADVYTYVNKIRERVDLPGLPQGLTKDQMREAIHHERRIELVFENHRYFDSRRWGLAEKTESKPIHSLNIMKGTNLQDDDFYERIVVEPRVFEQKHYWFPVPQEEINRTERVLVQNPGWTVDE